MKRRTVFGLVTGLAVSVAAGAGALAFGAYGAHGGGRHAIVKRMVVAAIDDVLDEAKVTAEQRRAIHAARDRVLAVAEETRAGRHAHLEEALALFEADQPDPARVEALHRQADEERQRVREAIHAAILEAHAVLTPAQRKVVADRIRSHRLSHWH
jgi:Spy/CpxP family protein refolding chaperone